MRKRIELTEEKLKNLNYEDFIAITLAEGGAMGSPGLIEIVDEDLSYYYTHFGKIDSEILEDKLSFLKTVRLEFGNIKNLEKNWVGLYTGAGNYLFVRPKYEKPILKYIDDNYKDTDKPKIIKLYLHWREALENMVKTNNG